MTPWRLVVSRKAEAEAGEAARWYEGERAGLGKSFLERIDLSLDDMTENPLRFPLIYRDIRRAMVWRFPYGLYFRIRPGATIKVVAILHLASDPRRWQTRR